MKLPVFFHIPKNAGTYIGNICFRLIQQISGGNICHIDVYDKNVIKYRFICQHNQPLNTEVFVETWRSCYSTNISNIQYILDNLSVKMIRIADAGFKSYKKDLYPLISDDIRLFEFMVLRDPYERSLSLYSYIKSSQSEHEPTHNSLGEMSFHEYLNSPYLEGGWLIRHFLGVPNETPITEEHYKETCEILDNMNIYDISQVYECISDIFRSCYNLESCDIDGINVFENKTKEKIVVPFDGLDQETREKFILQTYWDHKLYRRYVK